jgi:hypothetical protein
MRGNNAPHQSAFQLTPYLQHLLAGMKRAKRDEDVDETPRSEKRQRLGK